MLLNITDPPKLLTDVLLNINISLSKFPHSPFNVACCPRINTVLSICLVVHYHELTSYCELSV